MSDVDSNSLFATHSQVLMLQLKQSQLQRMLNFDYVCKKESPSLVGIVCPGSSLSANRAFFGAKEILVPIYPSLSLAFSRHPKCDILLNLSCACEVFDSTLEALNSETIRTIIISAEGVPERDCRRLIAIAAEKHKFIIGPSSIGVVKPGIFRAGNYGGTMENVLMCSLHRPGSVGIISRSAGLCGELLLVAANKSDGVAEAVGIGNDTFPGTTIAFHAKRMQRIPECKVVVILSEYSNEDLLEVAQLIKCGDITKPLVCCIIGGSSTVFSHTTGAVNESLALQEAGAIVVDSFDEIGSVLEKLYVTYKHEHTENETGQKFSLQDIQELLKQQKERISNQRKQTSIVTTVADDRHEHLAFSSVSADEVTGIGQAIGLLWLKRNLSKKSSKFLETVISMCAEDGPTSAPSHSSIVSSMTTGNVVNSLCSGLLTMSDENLGRVGNVPLGKIFSQCVHSNEIAPDSFVSYYQHHCQFLPGFTSFYDSRVAVLKNTVTSSFTYCPHTTFFSTVENLTQLHLTLPAMATLGLLDMAESTPSFTEAEIGLLVETDLISCLMLVARSIGLLGHALDQQNVMFAMSHSANQENQNEIIDSRLLLPRGRMYKFPPHEMHYTQQNLV